MERGNFKGGRITERGMEKENRRVIDYYKTTKIHQANCLP